MTDNQSSLFVPDAEEYTHQDHSLEMDGLKTHISDEMDASDNESVTSENSNVSDVEPFSDYLPTIEQLLCEIGLEGFAVEAIQHGYSFENCVYALNSLEDDKEQYILRVPQWIHGFGDEDEKCEKVLNDVSLLNNLARKLPVPRVKAYSATRENALGKPFTLQTRLPGRSLDDIWADLDQMDKLAIVDLYVELLATHEAITFATAGTFIAPHGIPDSMNDVATTAAPSIRLFDDGDEEFMKDPKALQDRAGSDVKALLISHLNGWIAKDLRHDGEDEAIRAPKLRGLLAIVDDLDREGAFVDKPSPIVLHHWDLEPRNMMVEKNDGVWRISGVIDWDDTLAQSRPLTRKPPSWIWDFDEEEFTDYMDNDHHPNFLLTEENMALKTHFDAKAAAALPGYLEDAYGRGQWLRRIWTFAKDEIHQEYLMDRMDELQEDWDSRPKSTTPQPLESSMPKPEEVFEHPLEQPLTHELAELTVPEPEKPRGLWKKSLGWLSLRVKALRP